jgi:hypothetical protein
MVKKSSVDLLKNSLPPVTILILVVLVGLTVLLHNVSNAFEFLLVVLCFALIATIYLSAIGFLILGIPLVIVSVMARHQYPPRRSLIRLAVIGLLFLISILTVSFLNRACGIP